MDENESVEDARAMVFNLKVVDLRELEMRGKTPVKLSEKGQYVQETKYERGVREADEEVKNLKEKILTLGMAYETYRLPIEVLNNNRRMRGKSAIPTEIANTLPMSERGYVEAERKYGRALDNLIVAFKDRVFLTSDVLLEVKDLCTYKYDAKYLASVLQSLRGITEAIGK